MVNVVYLAKQGEKGQHMSSWRGQSLTKDIWSPVMSYIKNAEISSEM